MEIYKENGIYGEGDVYVLKSLEDFDEYEKLLLSKGEGSIKKYNPNFYSFKEDFIKYVGKIWQDKNKRIYTLNGIPKYKEYKVIAIEDNLSWDDWYWLLQNTQNEKDIKYLLANGPDLKDGLKQ